MVDDLDDTATMADAILIFCLLDAEQYAVADAGGFTRPRLPGHMDADFGRGAVRVLVPFVRSRDKVAIAVARGHVREHGRGQGAWVMEFLAPLLDRSFVGQFTKQALEVGTQSILQAECARDFAGANFTGIVPDEGDYVGFGGQGGSLFGFLVQNRESCAINALLKLNVVVEI